MTLRLRRHFTTRTVIWAGVLVLFWAPVLSFIGFAPTEFYSVHSQEQKEKEQKKQDEPLLRIETELVQIDVVVTDNRIVSIGARGNAPAGARVIDVSGKTIIPGFVDVHAHLRRIRGA